MANRLNKTTIGSYTRDLQINFNITYSIQLGKNNTQADFIKEGCSNLIARAKYDVSSTVCN
eukprot:7704156-Ditylum_brightwellii.AAC.1